MVQNPPVRGMVSEYARAFVKQLNMLQDSLLNDLCDCLDYDHLRKIMEAWLLGEDPPNLAPNPGIHREDRSRRSMGKSLSKAMSITRTFSMGMVKAYSMKSISSLSRLKTNLSLSSLGSKHPRRQSGNSSNLRASDRENNESPHSSEAEWRDTLRRSGTNASEYVVAQQASAPEAGQGDCAPRRSGTNATNLTGISSTAATAEWNVLHQGSHLGPSSEPPSPTQEHRL